MSDPINELLVFTRQELLNVFKDWYNDNTNTHTLQDAIDATDYIIHQLNENKPK